MKHRISYNIIIIHYIIYRHKNNIVRDKLSAQKPAEK